MTLDQHASIGEIVGAIGVVISLVYLAIQNWIARLRLIMKYAI